MGDTEELHIMSTKMKYATSGAVWFNLLAMSISNNFLSPALLEFKNKYDTDISTISAVFTVSLIAYLAGATICGIIYNYVNRQLIVICLVLLDALAILLIPHCPSLYLFFCCGAMIGFACGGYDTAQFVWIIEMWQGQAGPYIQTQHFFYALGTLISPLLLAPFLSAANSDPGDNGTSTVADIMYNSLEVGSSKDHTSQLTIPFTLGAGILVFGAWYLSVLFWVKRYEPPVPSGPGGFDDEDSLLSEAAGNAHFRTLSSKWYTIIVVGLCATVLGAYQGMEYCSFQFIPTYSHYISLHLSQQDGALVLSVLAASFTIGRCLGIFIILKVIPTYILCGNLTIITIGTILMCTMAENSYTVLWIGCIILGVGYSTFFASFYAFIENNLRVTNTVGTVLVVVAGCIMAGYPWVLGQFVEDQPEVLMYTNFFSLSVIITGFAILCWVTRKRQRIREMCSIKNA